MDGNKSLETRFNKSFNFINTVVELSRHNDTIPITLHCTLGSLVHMG